MKCIDNDNKSLSVFNKQNMRREKHTHTHRSKMKTNSIQSSDPLIPQKDSSIKQRLTNGKLVTFSFLLMLIVVIACVFALPITQIVLGSLYINQCPINNLIPIHLIITGVSTLLLFTVVIIQVRRLFLYLID